ncbi:DUF1310 family protein [Listeria valentina]|uniref:DUF1310 family protein n=1 Tax=Listeria valentina TaxID=2705293 RepID=UPI001431CD8F|nr:DUF1310 family protein [Listeria valentina]
MKKGWIIFISIVVIIIAVVAIVGGKMYMDNKKLDEDMKEVVKSEEAKNQFEEGLKNLDPNAFTKNGVIKSYKIDYDSIKHNPMGGINVRLIINGNSKLTTEYTLNKYDGKLEAGGISYSHELDILLQEKDSND